MSKTPRKPIQKAAEAAAVTLTDQEAAFVAAYLDGPSRYSAHAAAIAAGYSTEYARAHAWELRRRKPIDDAIRKVRAETLLGAYDNADRFKRELASIGYSRVNRVVEWDGENLHMVPSELVDDPTLAAISEVRKTARGVAVKFHSKTEALRLLGQANGWLGKDATDNPDAGRADALKELRDLMLNGRPDIEPPADP